MHAHTGRATRTVLENLPRDLVLELEPTPLAQLVAAIVGLQERQLVRVFEVPEPLGPWVTVLVYLPRHRFTAELPERIADAVAGAYAAERRTFESVRRRQLAGPHRRQRAPRRARRSASTSTPSSAPIDQLSTSWSDRLRAALVAEDGDEARARAVRAHRCPRAGGLPRRGARRSGRSATSGASPRSLDGDADLTHVARPRGRRAAGGVALPRVPARAAGGAVRAAARCSTTSGCRRSTSGRTRSASATSGCSSTTSVSASPPASSSTSHGATTSSGRSPPCSRPSIESDGFNRLVLRAGLDARARSRSSAPTASTCARSASPSASSTSRTRWRPTRRLVADLVALFHARFDPAGRDAGRDDERASARSSTALDADPQPRRRPHLPCLPDPRRRHRPHQLLPRPAGDRVQVRPGRDPRPPAAPAEARDLGVRAAGRGRPPARRRHRPRRAALERPAGGLPHRGPRADEGADGEERGHRADRRQGRLRRQAPARRPRGAARPRSSSATARSSAACSTSPTTSSPGRTATSSCTRRTPSSDDGDDPYLVVAADKGTATFSDIANEIAVAVRLLARRRVRVGRQRRLRPQGDGHHGPRGVGERAPPRQRARQGRRPRPADRRRHRRHVGRRVRQRDAALAGPAARRRLRPPPRLHRPRPRSRRSPSPSGSGCSTCPARAGPTTTRR